MKLKKVLKKLHIVDILIITTIIVALIIGFMTFKRIRQTSDKQILSTSEVVFHVFVRGFSFTGHDLPIKINEKSFITIRNVPYSELDVKDVIISPRKTAIEINKDLRIIDDPASPNLYDMVVILSDEAKITKDGAVVGGNKLKIGLPITLEGAEYKLNGTVSNVIVIEQPKDNK